jgi:hypothetical protein
MTNELHHVNIMVAAYLRTHTGTTQLHLNKMVITLTNYITREMKNKELETKVPEHT